MVLTIVQTMVHMTAKPALCPDVDDVPPGDDTGVPAVDGVHFPHHTKWGNLTHYTHAANTLVLKVMQMMVQMTA